VKAGPRRESENLRGLTAQEGIGESADVKHPQASTGRHSDRNSEGPALTAGVDGATRMQRGLMSKGHERTGWR